MRAVEVEQALVDWSARNSGHQARRGYIGLSQMGDCERRVVEELRRGRLAPVEELLKHKLAFEIEWALKARLRAVFGEFRDGEEICLHDGLVRGHPDGRLADGDLVEIKTIGTVEHIPGSVREMPRRVFFQAQAYLAYTTARVVHVVYLARDCGRLSVLGVRPTPAVILEIRERVERLARAVERMETPACTCRRCPDGAAGGPGPERERAGQ